MVLTELDAHYVEQAEARTQAERVAGYAVSARYDPRNARLVVETNTGVEIAVPVRLVEGPAGGSRDDLSDIEITAFGLGSHWPRLDADLRAGPLARRLRFASLDGRATPKGQVDGGS